MNERINIQPGMTMSGIAENLRRQNPILSDKSPNQISQLIFAANGQAGQDINKIRSGQTFDVSSLFNFANSDKTDTPPTTDKPVEKPKLTGREVIADKTQKTSGADETGKIGNKNLSPQEKEKLMNEYEELTSQVDNYQLQMAVGKYEETQKQRKEREDYPGIKNPPGRGLLAGEVIQMSGKIARLKELEAILGINDKYDLGWRDKLVWSRQVDPNGRDFEVIPPDTKNDPEILGKLNYI